VTFYDGTTVIGTGATANGIASFSSMLTPRVHYIKAVYPGDPTFNASTRVVKVQAFGKQSVTDLNVSPNPAIYGQSITLSAMVYPLTFPPFPQVPTSPTGTVKFRSNGYTIGTATLEDTFFGWDFPVPRSRNLL